MHQAHGHKERLKNWLLDPDRYDNQKTLQNARNAAERQGIIEGRAKVLEGMVKKHEGELAKKEAYLAALEGRAQEMGLIEKAKDISLSLLVPASYELRKRSDAGEAVTEGEVAEAAASDLVNTVDPGVVEMGKESVMLTKEEIADPITRRLNPATAAPKNTLKSTERALTRANEANERGERTPSGRAMLNEAIGGQ